LGVRNDYISVRYCCTQTLPVLGIPTDFQSCTSDSQREMYPSSSSAGFYFLFPLRLWRIGQLENGSSTWACTSLQALLFLFDGWIILSLLPFLRWASCPSSQSLIYMAPFLFA
jgi:hypothetical protein